MKHALISPDGPIHNFDGSSGLRIWDVVNREFPVAAPFYWVEVADNVTGEDYYWDGSEPKLIPIPPPPPEPTEP